MKYLLLTILLTACYSGFSQFTIKGQIRDTSNSPISYASVYLQKSNYGTVSDGNGEFKLLIKSEAYTKDSLVVSFIGYTDFKISVNLTATSSMNIVLESSTVTLNSAQVVASDKKELKALQIVKKAIRNRDKNYINTSYTAEGFYRETVVDDGDYIKVNEAAIRFNFSKYPQKHSLRGGFKKYWNSYYDHYRFLHKSGGFPRLAQLLPYYNSKNDLAKILASRFSNQLGTYKYSVNPVGGPLDLTGNDKLKYQYDFFDSKLFKEYEYKKKGIIEYNGELCYLIHFQPKKSIIGNYSHNYSKKMEHAVYNGELIISINDFSVFQISCERLFLTNCYNAFFSENLFPVRMNMTLNYTYNNTAKKLMLRNVINEQTFVLEKKEDTSEFEVRRELWVSDSIINTDKEEYPWQERLDLTRNSTIEDYTESYDELFWKDYKNSTLYKPLNDKAVNDLETNMSLEEQYKSQFTPIDSMAIPECDRHKDYLVLHEDSLKDNYRWLEAKSEETLEQIKKENTYYNQVQSRLKKYKKEFIGKVSFVVKKDTTISSSISDFNGYSLDTRMVDDSLRLFQLMGDSSKRELFNYHSINSPDMLWGTSLSDDLSFIAYDFNRDYALSKTLEIKNIGLNSEVRLSSVCEYKWLNDSILVYSSTDLPGKYPANKVYWYNANTNHSELLLAEDDNSRELELVRSVSKEFIFVSSATKEETEVHTINQQLVLHMLSSPEKEATLTVNHFSGNYLVGLSDYTGLYRLPLDPSGTKEMVFKSEGFQTILDYRETKNHYLVSIYELGKTSLYGIDKLTLKRTKIPFEGKFSYTEILSTDFTTDACQVSYESPTTPYGEFTVDISTGKKQVLRTPLELNASPEYFEVKQVTAKSADGEKIPITYLNRRFIKEKKGTILRVYGAYGSTPVRAFSEIDLALADLGFIVAYAHVRGGMEKGKEWYLDGKHLSKKNSIADFISCAKHLIDINLATDSTLVAYGVSAGGIVIGGAINAAPELFNTVILDRPLLDVLTTQSNDTLSLTTVEYSEIGDPANFKDYEYTRSYCPYQNISKKNYPNMMYFAGQNDWNASYWNGLKHIASIRENNQCNTKQVIQLNKGSHYIPWSKGIDDFGDIYAFLMYTLVESKK